MTGESTETKNQPRGKWREDSPRGLCTKAQDFRNVGRDALEAHKTRLRAESPTGTILIAHPPSFPVYYLFLHAIELVLKAYLRQMEVATLKELRSKKYGHDISELIRAATANGLDSLCQLTPRQREAIYQVAGLYLEKRFEYFQLGLVTIPPIEPIAEATDVLINGIRRMKLRLAENPQNG